METELFEDKNSKTIIVQKLKIFNCILLFSKALNNLFKYFPIFSHSLDLIPDFEDNSSSNAMDSILKLSILPIIQLK
jgi:hypothetical protein